MTGWKFAFMRGGYAFLRMLKEGSTSFFEKKRSKKTFVIGGAWNSGVRKAWMAGSSPAMTREVRGLWHPQRQNPPLAKIFCFFFSKKKRLLA
jgi:hypothetical protein